MLPSAYIQSLTHYVILGRTFSRFDSFATSEKLTFSGLGRVSLPCSCNTDTERDAERVEASSETKPAGFTTCTYTSSIET